MKSLHKFRHGLDTVLSWVCALLFAAMVVVGTYQIVTRYFFGRPSTVSEELLYLDGPAFQRAGVWQARPYADGLFGR